MRNFYKQIDETLTLSAAREYTKGWNRKRHVDLFGDKKRIYLTLPNIEIDIGDTKSSEAFLSLEREIKYISRLLEPKDRRVAEVDFESGLIERSNGQKMRIGRYINSLINQSKNPAYDDNVRSIVKTTLKAFNDETAARGKMGKKASDYLVVISRHPVDIAGMSTDRGWDSCMNLGRKNVLGGMPTKPSEGCNVSYVRKDIDGGSLIAYMVREDDRNIKHPIGRILIKPHFGISEDDAQELENVKEILDNNEWAEMVNDMAEQRWNDAAIDIALREIRKWDPHNDENVFYVVKNAAGISVDKPGYWKEVKTLIDEWMDEIKKSTAYDIPPKPRKLLEYYLNNVFDDDEYNDEIHDLAYSYAENDMVDDGYMHQSIFDASFRNHIDTDDVYYKIGSKIYGSIPNALIPYFMDTIRRWLREKQSDKHGPYILSPDVYGGDETDHIIRV